MEEPKIRRDSLFLLISSWSRLLNDYSPGFYKKSPILRIHNDPVIFFTITQMKIDLQGVRTYIFFGLGYYFSKFDLSAQGYVLDHRELTGLTLGEDIYNQLISAPKITLESDPDVILNENFTQIPLHLRHKTDTQRSFIKGAFVREVFSPYKEIIQEMMTHISNYQSYNLNTEGHKFLLATPDNFNKILVGEKLKLHPESPYLETTAGIKEIGVGVENLIKGIFTDSQLDYLNQTLIRMKETFATLNYDRTYLFSILERADEVLPEIDEIVPNSEKPSPPDQLKIRERPHVNEDQIPVMPQDSVEKILQYLSHLIAHDYSIRTIVQAFTEARESIHHHLMYTSYMYEMEKFVNTYSKVEPGRGLSPYEKRNLTDKLEKWMDLGI